MGTGASKNSIHKIMWAMPSWCIEDFNVNSTTISLANDSWRYCMSGDAPPYHLAHAKEASLTPLVFFYNQFYYYLFELLPEVKSMFTKGMAAQGRMLANVVKYIITNLDADHASVFKDSLQHLARVHNVRGVTAEHYSVMGMCLVHTVRICTGTKYFTDAHKDAWVHIYSKMMGTIIPVVVAGTIPDLADMDRPEQFGKSVYMKNATANLNSEGDKVHESKLLLAQKEKVEAAAARKKAKKMNMMMTGGAACPVSGAVGSPNANGCPAAKFNRNGSQDDLDSSMMEVSVTMQNHYTESAIQHIATLKQNHQAAMEAQAVASMNPADKYKHLKRVLGVAQQVEMQLRDQGAEAISGAQLMAMLETGDLVGSHIAAIQTANYFLQFQLMHLVTPTGAIIVPGVPTPAPASDDIHVDRTTVHYSTFTGAPGGTPMAGTPLIGAAASAASSSVVNAAVAAAIAAAHPIFVSDDATLYSFGPTPLPPVPTPVASAMAAGAITAIGTPLRHPVPRTASIESISNQENSGPKCYIGAMAPGNVLHALDRTPSSSVAPSPIAQKAHPLGTVAEK